MSTSGQSKVSVRQALRDRCLTVASPDDATTVVRYLDPRYGGVVFSSSGGFSRGHAVKRMFPGLIIAADHRERDKEEKPATPAEPIALPNLGGLFTALAPEDALDQFIEGQLHAGAHVGVIPGRVIRAEDSDSLAAVVESANAVDRDDVIVRIPVSHTWFLGQNVRQLNGILGRSRHPVALSPADKRDPMENKGVPEGLRRVIDTHGDKIIVWKTDLAGIDALTRGALATAVGVVASLRHSSPPGGFGQKINERDLTPQVFIPKLLRYMRASHLHDEVFASTQPWTCDCKACCGKSVARFTGSAEHLREAAIHNALAITGLHQRIIGAPAGARAAEWQETLESALAAHQELALYVERKMPFPRPLQYWLNHA
jgi:hypothetical protein